MTDGVYPAYIYVTGNPLRSRTRKNKSINIFLKVMEFTTDHIHLKAQNALESSKWYVEHFGAIITEQVDWTNMFTIRLLLGGVMINVTQHKDTVLEKGTFETHLGLDHFGIKTDNIDDVWSMLEETGTQFLSPIKSLPNGTRVFFIKGPDNVRIELLEYPHR